MELNKDNKNIYSVERDSYKEEMGKYENNYSVLDLIIKVLLLLLILLVTYFTYRVVEKKLSVSETFQVREEQNSYKMQKTTENLSVEEIKIIDKVTIPKKVPISMTKDIKKVVIETSRGDTLTKDYLELIKEELNSM